MTSIPVDRARQLAEAGRLLSTALGWLLYAVGWQAAKLYRLVGTTLGVALWTIGYLAGRTWAAGRWAWAAVSLGWDAGQRPMGSRRGPA